MMTSQITEAKTLKCIVFVGRCVCFALLFQKALLSMSVTSLRKQPAFREVTT